MHDLLSLFPEELLAIVKEMGEPAYRADQIFRHAKEGTPPGEMSSLPKALRERIASEFEWRLPEAVDTLVSPRDGTVKYLFRLLDGECIESVLMRYRHGNTLCISSQVGCRMGCRFCASTIGGKVRDLLPSEMLGQIIAAQRLSGERVSNIVMMGIGEPLDNYENVVRFLRLVNHKDGVGIGYRHISLSTCGLCDGIRRLAKEKLPITLSVSLHATSDEARDELMPVNRRYPIAELMRACRDYFLVTGRRISFEYALIAGKNDTPEDARRLATLLRSTVGADGAPIHVNLIRVNAVPETGFSGTSAGAAATFAERLERLGVVATVRRRLGSDVNAACGQLRRARGASPRLAFFAGSDCGRVRKRNEDRFLTLPLGASGCLAAVFDGMGGHARGDVAAELAEAAFREVFSVTPKTRQEVCRLLEEAARLADFSISHEACREEGSRGMGTTVSALAVLDGEAFTLSIGDSRVYCLREGKLLRLTRDDSYVQELVDTGRLSSDEAAFHPHRNVLTRSLGSVGDGELSVSASPVCKGDIYLLCTDGLYDMLGDAAIRRLLSQDMPPAETVGYLIAAANENGGRDNITAACVRVSK